MYSTANHPHHQSDIAGWRSARVANIKGKFVSIEFDPARHPDQLPQIFTNTQIRKPIPDDGVTAHLDFLTRKEVPIPSADLAEWITQILTSGHIHEHERETFFD